jgi:hypothetical protein
MIVQADKADLGPAVMYLLFDAEDARQNKYKERSLTFAGGQGMVNSALEVVLGGFPFTAIGHETETRWTTVDGIPAVEAAWWAGGLRVTERIFALAGKNAFLRRIELKSANLAGPEQVTLRLSLPPGSYGVLRADDAAGRSWANGMLAREDDRVDLALGAVGPHRHVADAQKGTFEVGPLPIAPGASVSVDTVLVVGFPPSERTAMHVPTLRTDFDLTAAMQETREAWRAASSIATDDATVREVFDHVRFALPGMIAENGTMDAGIFEYGNQWVRDTSITLTGMVHAGYFELARNGFEHLLRDMIRDEGATMVDSKYDNPDREELDQMGELMHALKVYRDWTGDDSPIRKYRTRLLAMIERPLRPEFRDETGMVHNRREFFERTLDDGYELAYQTFVTSGLRDAADLAEPLGAQDRAPQWRAEADRMWQAVLSHPTRSLVDNGRLVKRRNTKGQVVKEVSHGGEADSPGATEKTNLAEPDSATAYPIVLGLVDPRSALAARTLDKLEELWNARWTGGGYERYHSSGQGDQPGPWPMMSILIMRAQHDAGQFDRSRRTLNWLAAVQGAPTGAWFEEIPVIRFTPPTSGIVPWASGDFSLFVVRHLLGVRFEGERLVLKPALYPKSPPMKADLRFHKGRLKLEITGPGPIDFAEINGQRTVPDSDGAVRLPAEFPGGSVVLHTKSVP